MPREPSTAEAEAHDKDEQERSHDKDERVLKYYRAQQLAQQRAAVAKVLEATLEATPQIILQLYILVSEYEKSSEGSSIFSKKINDEDNLQIFSVVVSLLSLTYSLTSYHSTSKLGGLPLLQSLPLLFSIFFQVNFNIEYLILLLILLINSPL